MSLEQIIEELKAKAIPKGEVVEVEIPNPDPTRAIPVCDLPADMPHTNRLDRMTTQQAKWAIQNGGAWNAYLKEQLASGADVNLVAHEAKLAYEPPTPAETFDAICEIVENVWLDLTDNLKRKTLRENQIADWAEVLHWAIKALPTGYECHRDIFEDALRGHQTELNKREVTS